MTGALIWRNVPHTRVVAFALHLIISLLVFSSLVAMMLVFWFPGDLFLMDGGWEGLKLVAMVDLVLGPALTLILFKPGKPGLKLDLSVIAAIQIAALAYGFHTTYKQRTVAVVFGEDTFATVSAMDNQKANEELLEQGITPGQIPAATAFSVPLLLTPAAENFGDYISQVLNGFPDAHRRSDQYIALDGQHSDMEKHRLTAERLEENGDLPLIQTKLSKLDRTIENVEVYKFRARYADGYALYDPAQSRIIDFVSSGATSPENQIAESTE